MGHSILKSYYYTSLQSQAWNYIFLAVKKREKFPRESSKTSFAEHMLWVFGVHRTGFLTQKNLGKLQKFLWSSSMIAQFKQVCDEKWKKRLQFPVWHDSLLEHSIMHELYIFHKHKKHTFGILESSFFQTTSLPYKTQEGIVGDFKCISIWQLSQPHARLSWKPHWSRIAGISKF